MDDNLLQYLLCTLRVTSYYNNSVYDRWKKKVVNRLRVKSRWEFFAFFSFSTINQNE